MWSWRCLWDRGSRVACSTIRLSSEGEKDYKVEDGADYEVQRGTEGAGGGR